MNSLSKHKWRKITTGGLDSNVFPPTGKPSGAASKLKQLFYTNIFFNQVCNHFFLPHFSSLIPTFIPLLVGVSMFAVKKPFFTSLPAPKFFCNEFKCHVCSFSYKI